MSQKYPGGFITKSPVAPTTSAASGIWTLDQQVQAQKAGTWPSPPMFIEDVFNTFVWSGTTATRTITNDIDLSGKGGLVWTKRRSDAVEHLLYDTTRGALKSLSTNDTTAENSYANTLTAFGSTGFTLGSSSYVNATGQTYVGWTFREQPKFFDIVTYTGTGVARTVAHNLGSAPGCIIVKNTSASGDWWNVYHRSLGATKALFLNDSQAAGTYANVWNNTEPTSTVFSLGTSGEVNRNGDSFVAYLFAHDAGGFPVSGGGSTNGISCGAYTGNSGTQSISLGYEPQWLLIKKATASGTNRAWWLTDTMRGFANGSGADTFLFTQSTSADSTGWDFVNPTATGFDITTGDDNFNTSGISYIYVAIRRGPMKAPTTGTSVYNAIARTGTGAVTNITGVGFPPDLFLLKRRDASTPYQASDKLRGLGRLVTSATDSEYGSDTAALRAFIMDGIEVGDGSSGGFVNTSGSSYINHFMRRAPSFMDVVCYTGTGVARTVTHNLATVPELMIVKCRTPAGNDWMVYASPLGNQAYLQLNRTNVATTSDPMWNNTTPTSSVFSVGVAGDVNGSGNTLVAYLFATCNGVSKVGSYSGNTGVTVTVPCGFTSGVRFVLIKRTDVTGAWYVWDTARGIISGNDPYLLLNSTAAEDTSTDYIDTYSAGFEVTDTAPAALNATGGTYIFLAIA